ncbi:MAG TPA: hypothetical protein VGN16_11785 [Acidobacteriaceae bacterium]|jgi:hypothetical protein
MPLLSLGTIPEWCTTVTAIISLRYLIDYARAAKAQVLASQDQVGISDRQVSISQEQIRVSQEQIKLSQAQVEIAERHMREQMRPVLVMTDLEAGSDRTVRFTIQNQGGGTAFDIRWESASLSSEQQHAAHSFVLGPNAQLKAPINLGPEMRVSLTYRSAFGEEYRSEILIVGELFSTKCYAAIDKTVKSA